MTRGMRTLPKGAPFKLVNAITFDMESKISGRTYRIFVSTPFAPPPDGGYPVAYFTDGNLTFPIAAAMGGAFGLSGKPVLVVGVGYPNPLELFTLRTRDLTPPTPLANIRAQPGLPPPNAENYGGADDFRRFLVDELRPAVAASYPVNAANQTLFGYSLGGLFTLSVLFNYPTSFRTFAAASPSIWWNKRSVLKDEPRLAAAVSGKAATPRILVTIGADEQRVGAEAPPGMTLAEARKLMREARMVDNAHELGERLAALKGAKGYETQFQAFEREDHLTSVAASISRTLAFALRG